MVSLIFYQVLDFLFLVQELKEKGNDTDDSEMALINNNNDMEKVSIQEFHVLGMLIFRSL